MRESSYKAGLPKWKQMRAQMMAAVVLAVILAVSPLTAVRVCAVTQEEDAALTKGIDVSSFNGIVDYEKVKAQGYTYVMIRAGSGQTMVDPNFSLNYGNAGAQGLKRGVYYYSYATTVKEAKKEAAQCLSILDNRNLECPVAYDMEEDAAFDTGKENVTAMAVAFCEAIKAAGYEPMLYASLNKLNEYFDYDSISQYQIWVANYDVDYPNYAYPYMMWQYHIGSVDGANTGSGECDEDYIYESFVPASTIALNATELALELGEGRVSSGALEAVVGGEDASNKHVNWTTQDDTVATVDAAGTVQAVGNGTTNIVASTVNGVTAQCAVTVTTPATAVSIGETELAIGKKENITLSPVLTPETSTDSVHYASSDESIVRVEDDGSLTGVAKGSAQITVTADSGVSTSVTVTVKKAPWRLSGCPLYKKLKVGESFTLSAKLPKNSASSKITYYSRNQYRVSVDDSGNATALAAGWCLLRTSTYNGKKEWTLVHVVE
jgi:GH25 family lysozyme M1 (1,4-beta-N-acetylmuramidase)